MLNCDRVVAGSVNRLHKTLVAHFLQLHCNVGRCGLFTHLSYGPYPLYPPWLPPTSQALQCSGVALPCVCPPASLSLTSRSLSLLQFPKDYRQQCISWTVVQSSSAPLLHQLFPWLHKQSPLNPKMWLVDISSRMPRAEWCFANYDFSTRPLGRSLSLHWGEGFVFILSNDSSS